ncbi:hypothetical protein F4778DRAFT_562312 [Xylariomycetidae sp. FL2044]|nr:hypothetical protein F4778DRAFT_562312 [Xylariomycetidae sp. FL2044]
MILYLPIEPCEPHPDNGILLRLENPDLPLKKLKLKKPSYVKTADQDAVDYSILSPYARHGPEYFLSKDSYQVLIQYAKYCPPLPHPQTTAPSPHYLSVTPRQARVTSPTTSMVRGTQPNRRPQQAAEVDSAYDEFIESDLDPWVAYVRRLVERSRYQREYMSGVRAPPYRYDAERQHLLPRHANAASTTYRSITTRAGGHSGSYPGAGPIEPSDWANFRKIAKVVFWMTLFALGSYGAYRGFCWVIATVRAGVHWVGQEIEFIKGKITFGWAEPGMSGIPSNAFPR